MLNRIFLLMITMILMTCGHAFAAKIQQGGIVTTTDCAARGVSNINCLPSSAQVFDATLNEQLSTALSNGDIAIGSQSISVESLSNIGLTATVASNAMTVTLVQKNGSSAISTGNSSVSVAFRSSTLTNGGWAVSNITAPVSLVIPSGATLGQASGVKNTIYVYLLNNAGTIQLAVSLTAYSEGGFISANGINSSSGSANVVYSNVGAPNVPFRLIGELINTQPTAGLWTVAPTQISLPPFAKVRAPTMQVFTSGSGTYTTPNPAPLYLVVKMVGGGGGGQGTSAGGSAGGNSTFGSFLTASGGSGGNSGVGGIGGTGIINSPATGFLVPGGSGGSSQGASGPESISMISGYGGNSAWGGGAGGVSSGATGGAGSTNTGGGGSGVNYNSNQAGQAGGGAAGYLEAIVPNPASSYSYSVASGGSGGAGGPGGAGGSGMITVMEYYQ